MGADPMKPATAAATWQALQDMATAAAGSGKGAASTVGGGAGTTAGASAAAAAGAEEGGGGSPGSHETAVVTQTCTDTTASSSSSNGTKGDQSSSSLFTQAQDQAWLSTTVEKLQALLAVTLPPLLSSPSPAVREALGEVLVQLLSCCSKSLSSCWGPLMEMVLTLAQDEYTQVAMPCVEWLRNGMGVGKGRGAARMLEGSFVNVGKRVEGEEYGEAIPTAVEGGKKKGAAGGDGGASLGETGKSGAASEDSRMVGNKTGDGGESEGGVGWWVEGGEGRELALPQGELRDGVPLVKSFVEEFTSALILEELPDREGGVLLKGKKGNVEEVPQQEQQKEQQQKKEEDKGRKEAQAQRDQLMKPLLMRMCNNLLPSLKLGEAEGTMAAKRFTTALLCAGEPSGLEWGLRAWSGGYGPGLWFRAWDGIAGLFWCLGPWVWCVWRNGGRHGAITFP